MKVLLVDDKESIVAACKDFLEIVCECEVVVAFDGDDGWNALCEYAGEIPLIITDLQMPKMNGIELAQKIRLTGIPTTLVLHTGARPENVALDKIFDYVITKGDYKKIEEIVNTVRQNIQ